MAIRHVSEQKTTNGKNQLHEVFSSGSKLAFIIEILKYMSMYMCVYVCVYIYT